MGTRVCSCVRVRSRAGAYDSLIRGTCVSATRCLRKAIHRWNTHIHSVRIHNACMYLYPCAAGYTDARIADAGPPHTRIYVVRPCARACVRVRLGIRADTCERLPSAWTAGGSAHRRSTMRMRSTRTSAPGTPRVSPRCTWYAPPFRPERRTTAGGTRSAGRRCGAGRCARRRRRCARARVCADVWARACAGVHVCRYSCAYERRDISLYIYIYMYIHVCMQYKYTFRYIHSCVRDGYGRACGCTVAHAHALRLRAPTMRPLLSRARVGTSAGI
jgi:hypothetical protein